ncbi:MAG: fatty acyl-AMP ligase [Alphaproteobacteria bacterium]
MSDPTPRTNTRLPYRRCTFSTLPEALDYAAKGETGLNFYSARSDLVERIAYRDLRDQAMSLARKLVRLGLAPGERVALLADTNGDVMRGFFAASYAGLVPTPLPLPATFGGRDAYIDQIRRQIEGCGATAAFAPTELVGYLREAVASRAMTFVGTVAEADALPEDGADLPAIDADALCYLQYSSGSTRFPLGVAMTHRQALHNVRAIAEFGLKIEAGDRCTSWLPLYHDMGLVGFMLTPVACQMSVDYLATRDFARRPLLWLALITRNGGTLSFSPTFGYELCARRAETASTERLDLKSWRGAGIGGDMIRPKVMARFVEAFVPRGFRATAFVPSYGMAEVGLAISFAPLGTGIVTDRVDLDVLAGGARAVAPRAGANQDRVRDFALCGVPMPAHELEVRDEAGKALGQRRAGRVFTRGPSVMACYFGAPEETRRVIAPDGWLDTGDLGYWLGDQIVITGRAKDLILVNGRNLWPQDLEWAAERVPAVRSGDAAAFSVEDAEGERVVVLVQCRGADPGARAGLARDVAGTVNEIAGVECTVVLVPPRSLPQTSSGKLSRSKAKARYLAGDFEATAPSTLAS